MGGTAVLSVVLFFTILAVTLFIIPLSFADAKWSTIPKSPKRHAPTAVVLIMGTKALMRPAILQPSLSPENTIK
jgi:hypothetical protein